jgi:hypothetical protein
MVLQDHRLYCPALGTLAALGKIEKNKGILYDPEVGEVGRDFGLWSWVMPFALRVWG